MDIFVDCAEEIRKHIARTSRKNLERYFKKIKKYLQSLKKFLIFAAT